jgi:hypothetical protein
LEFRLYVFQGALDMQARTWSQICGPRNFRQQRGLNSWALGSTQECSGAYFSKTYEHGPESWTYEWTHVKPGWHPVFFRLASHFGGDSLANYCGLVSSARWQLDPLQLPQVSYNAPLHFRLLLAAGFGWLSRTKGGHSRACFRLSSGSPVENPRARGRETGGGEGGIRLRQF